MKKPMIRIHNAETNEVIDREMTDDEFEQLKTDKAEALLKKAEQEAKVAQKEALFAKLGITADEAKLLLG